MLSAYRIDEADFVEGLDIRLQLNAGKLLSCYEDEIRRIGRNDKIKKHLANLGFVPGEKVTLVSVNAGSVIVNVKNVRVGISDVLARRIMI